MARSEYWSCPLRLPTPAAAHVAIASGVSQRVTVHVKAITKGLKLSIETANDYPVFKDVVRIAAHCDKTPYDVDKLFWLVGSGRFYLHPSIGHVATDRDGYIQKASRVLG